MLERTQKESTNKSIIYNAFLNVFENAVERAFIDRRIDSNIDIEMIHSTFEQLNQTNEICRENSLEIL